MKNLSLTFCLTIAALFGSVGSGFASDLPDCIKSAKVWNYCFGTETWENDKYSGEWKNNDRHGQGTFTWSNGDKYVGEYKDDKRNGQGTYTFGPKSDWAGDKYVGEYKNGERNGQGTYTYADGTVEEGIWKDGEFQYAKTPTQDNEIISASSGSGFASDLPDCPSSGYFHNCFGTMNFDGGGKYVGEWKDGKSNGTGTETWANGEKYFGKFKNDKTNGQGIRTYANGDKYVGEEKNGKKHGKGTFTWADGDKYVGEFVDDKQHGQGTYTFGPNSKWAGDKYVGEHKDNKKHGHGTYYFVSGNKFVGEFRDDKINGQGIKTYVNGTVEEGIWKDGEFQYAKKLSPTVPVAKTPTQDEEIISASSGSGFAVSSDGYVITNHHVIEGCQKVVVHTKDKDLTVRVTTYDPQNDLALLKGDFRPQTVFPLSNNRPELLQDIYVAGYPFGNKVSTSVKVTKGIISSLTGIGNNFSNIQIDAALQSGNSGGPILDDLGNVVGVAVSKLDAKYMFDNFGSIPENTNFGIKSIIVRSVLDSNEVDSPPANQSEISKSKLGKMISSGTYYISCWMTMAQIEKMKTKKVFFSNLD